MARYKQTEKDQGLFLTVDLSKQIIPDTYEYTLKYLIDSHMDLTIFDTKYKNDETGATAIEPRILLKIILYCYSMGVISSRKIAKLCETHMIVKALAQDSEPHYTTISNFVSGMGEEIEKVFSEVLLFCDDMNLIGGRMFAVDGCKLPSNASKEWSGTNEELQKRYDKLKKVSKKILAKHRLNDKLGTEELAADKRKLKKMRNKMERISNFISVNRDRLGASGEIVKSNITDNESGKIQCSRGVIQGYNGIAVADSKKQIIVAANAYGTVAEGQFFPEMLEATEEAMQVIKGKNKPLEGTVFLGDNAFFSEDNLQAAKKKGVEAIIPDEQFRNRDEDLKDGERRRGKERFDARHFKYVKNGNHYICPNKKKLLFRSKVKLNRNEGNKYESKASDCHGCPYVEKCLQSRKKEKKYRTLYIPISKYDENLSQKMREKIDKPKYKRLYSNRLKIIEPVFSNITYCKGMDRFTLRTQKKVMIQWLLYCIVHNISKCNMSEKQRLRVFLKKSR
jgi:transposase